MENKRRVLMSQRAVALAQGNIAEYQRLTIEIARLPMKGVKPLTQADINRYMKKR